MFEPPSGGDERGRDERIGGVVVAIETQDELLRSKENNRTVLHSENCCFVVVDVVTFQTLCRGHYCQH